MANIRYDFARGIGVGFITVALAGCGSSGEGAEHRATPPPRDIRGDVREPQPESPLPTLPNRRSALDRATAWFVAAASEDAYWLCGEAEECSNEPQACYGVAADRVDCVVRYSQYGKEECGVIIAVRLAGREIQHGSYSCAGRVPRRNVILRRFTSDIDWPIAGERNRYGVPRFDLKTDLYDP